MQSAKWIYNPYVHGFELCAGTNGAGRVLSGETFQTIPPAREWDVCEVNGDPFVVKIVNPGADVEPKGAYVVVIKLSTGKAVDVWAGGTLRPHDAGKTKHYSMVNCASRGDAIVRAERQHRQALAAKVRRDGGSPMKKKNPRRAAASKNGVDKGKRVQSSPAEARAAKPTASYLKALAAAQAIEKAYQDKKAAAAQGAKPTKSSKVTLHTPAIQAEIDAFNALMF